MDPNAPPGSFGRTPLIWCASKAPNDENARSIALQLLARDDIKVNQRDESGRTALFGALNVGNSAVIAALLRHPAFYLQDNGFESEADVWAVLGVDSRIDPVIPVTGKPQ